VLVWTKLEAITHQCFGNLFLFVGRRHRRRLGCKCDAHKDPREIMRALQRCPYHHQYSSHRQTWWFGVYQFALNPREAIRGPSTRGYIHQNPSTALASNWGVPFNRIPNSGCTFFTETSCQGTSRLALFKFA
jgi:hypothetical protein